MFGVPHSLLSSVSNPEVPPKIVMQKLRAAVDFPLAEDFERLAIEHENAAWAVAVGISERANVNALPARSESCAGANNSCARKLLPAR